MSPLQLRHAVSISFSVALSMWGWDTKEEQVWAWDEKRCQSASATGLPTCSKYHTTKITNEIPAWISRGMSEYSISLRVTPGWMISLEQGMDAAQWSDYLSLDNAAKYQQCHVDWAAIKCQDLWLLGTGGKCLSEPQETPPRSPHSSDAYLIKYVTSLFDSFVEFCFIGMVYMKGNKFSGKFWVFTNNTSLNYGNCLWNII